MGRLFIAFLFLFAPLISLCQEKQRINELGFSVFKSSTLPFTSFSSFQVVPMGINVLYRYHAYEKFYFRASQSFYRYNSRNSHFTFKDHDYIQEINTSVGLEFRYFKTKTGKLSLYCGLDLTGFINTGQFSFVNADGNFAGDAEQKNTGIGIQPFYGIVFYPLKRLAFSLEGSLLLGIQKQEESFSNFKGFVQPTPNNVFSGYSQFFFIRHASVGWLF